MRRGIKDKMVENYYITSNGKLIRKENTVYFTSKEGKRAIPIKRIASIFLFGNVTLTSGVVKILFNHNIPVHIFTKYGRYMGSYYPNEKYLAGQLLVQQVKHYISFRKRNAIAKKIVEGGARNMLMNCRRYKQSDCVERIISLLEVLARTYWNTKIMHIEAMIRETYYQMFDNILPDDFKFEKRSRHPPHNEFNAMLSMGNSLLYTATLSEIYQTRMNPMISYLHEPYERRFSLSLDIADVFKPVIVDRLLFSLVLKGIIQPKHFRKSENACYLNNEGRRLFLAHFDKRLRETIHLKEQKKNVSYKRLIRLEIYKLMKHVSGEKEYEPFVIDW